ncbi:GNAT family N-acetyltransferase [Celeribacter sp.]|uniref:GNAT family N-acetyltransferase n=1 Tax=Celeribacter sp. TaxID=1890673 RepID=UPI003A92C9B6
MLLIRPLTTADRAAWETLWAGYLSFYESTVEQAVTDATFTRLTAPEALERGAFVAELDGAVVGFVHFIFHAHNWQAGDVCYLQDLFVSEAARGKGAARALIEAVYGTADANGTPSVYWMTQEFNHTARALYDRIGAKTPFIKYVRTT